MTTNEKQHVILDWSLDSISFAERSLSEIIEKICMRPVD